MLFVFLVTPFPLPFRVWLVSHYPTHNPSLYFVYFSLHLYHNRTFWRALAQVFDTRLHSIRLLSPYADSGATSVDGAHVSAIFVLVVLLSVLLYGDEGSRRYFENEREKSCDGNVMIPGHSTYYSLARVRRSGVGLGFELICASG